MSSEKAFVSVPETTGRLVGDPLPGTKLHQAYLWQEQYQGWFLEVDRICGQRGVLAPVAAADFIQVSRVAVHKRLKEGRLTGFMFHQVVKTNLLENGKVEYETEGQPVCFIPFVECLKWAQELSIRDGSELDQAKTTKDPLSQYLQQKGGVSDERGN